eukprot:357327-Chlamydomonas_euryale.AAC.6
MGTSTDAGAAALDAALDRSSKRSKLSHDEQGDSVGGSGAAAADGRHDGVLNEALLGQESVEALAAAYAAALPYQHTVLRQPFEDSLLRNVRDEIIQNINATYKETDLFKVFQTVGVCEACAWAHGHAARGVVCGRHAHGRMGILQQAWRVGGMRMGAWACRKRRGVWEAYAWTHEHPAASVAYVRHAHGRMGMPQEACCVGGVGIRGNKHVRHELEGRDACIQHGKKSHGHLKERYIWHRKSSPGHVKDGCIQHGKKIHGHLKERYIWHRKSSRRHVKDGCIQHGKKSHGHVAVAA